MNLLSKNVLSRGWGRGLWWPAGLLLSYQTAVFVRYIDVQSVEIKYGIFLLI